MAGNVPFLMKDLVLFAASVYLLRQDVMRVSLSAEHTRVSTMRTLTAIHTQGCELPPAALPVGPSGRDAEVKAEMIEGQRSPM
jgi:hypothetical protein